MKQPAAPAYDPCGPVVQRLLALAVFLLLAACASDNGFEVPAITPEGARVPYDVAIEGVKDDDLRELLRAVSTSVKLRERPPPTLPLLERRAQEDIALLQQALRSEGYYEASVSVRVDASTDPAKVVFAIDPGPAYRLGSADVVLAEDAESSPLLPNPASLGLKLQQRARAAEIADAQQVLLQQLQQYGFPYPELTERKVVVDRRNRTVHVAYSVDPGKPARFGPTTIRGLHTVEEDFVCAKIPWKPEARFDIRKFTALRDALLDTGLFSTIRIHGAEQVGEDGLLPVTVNVTERAHRTVGVGLTYQTDEGPGVDISWEHRNLFGRGERLTVGAEASDFTLATEANFRKPAFRRQDQALLADFRIAEDRPEAFVSRNLQTQVLLERTFLEDVRAAAGIGFKAAEIEENDETDQFALLFLPTRLSWDTTENLLDPTRGSRFIVNFAPYQDVLGSGVHFLKGSVGYSRYLRLTQQPDLVLAGRGRVGSIVGADREDVPADERFYAGGGGSVRGYAFQLAGPLDEEGDPIGGRSVLELGLEARVKVTETIGFVTFLDAGSAFVEDYPDFGEDLFVGAGVGLRYFTPIGPLRLDVAVPLDKRDVDDDFQLYVSIGQAF